MRGWPFVPLQQVLSQFPLGDCQPAILPDRSIQQYSPVNMVLHISSL